MFYDSSLLTQPHSRTDITYRAVPASQMAVDNNLSGLAGMILAGGVLSLLPGVNEGIIKAAMEQTVSEKKKELFDSNIKAINLGMA